MPLTGIVIPTNKLRVLPFEDEEYSFDGKLIDYELRDNHYWLSILKDLEFMSYIEDVLELYNGEYESIIDENIQNYHKELEALDTKMIDVMNRATSKHLYFADQFAFTYLAEDYELTYSALSENCDSDTTITQESAN